MAHDMKKTGRASERERERTGETMRERARVLAGENKGSLALVVNTAS